MVATDVRAPGSFGEYFDTARSPLNPASSGRGFFVYGTFPQFLVKGIAAALGLGDYGHVHLVGRVLAALFDIATVALTWHIGLLLAGPGVALAAAALMAFSVTAIQHSHFFTVDSFATFFATAALLALARVAVGAGAAWPGVRRGVRGDAGLPDQPGPCSACCIRSRSGTPGVTGRSEYACWPCSQC
jgi:hypothetical protein